MLVSLKRMRVKANAQEFEGMQAYVWHNKAQ